MAGDSRGQLDGLTDPLSEPLTLREAVGQGVVPWSYEATKKRLQIGDAATCRDCRRWMALGVGALPAGSFPRCP